MEPLQGTSDCARLSNLCTKQQAITTLRTYAKGSWPSPLASERARKIRILGHGTIGAEDPRRMGVILGLSESCLVHLKKRNKNHPCMRERERERKRKKETEKTDRQKRERVRRITTTVQKKRNTAYTHEPQWFGPQSTFPSGSASCPVWC